MKRFLTFLMAAALMLGAGAMTSCGGDDEQKAGTQLSGTAASLVGTWRTEANYGYYDMITLNADGTGVWREVDLEYGDDEFDAFRWSYEEMTRRLILTFFQRLQHLYDHRPQKLRALLSEHGQNRSTQMTAL